MKKTALSVISLLLLLSLAFTVFAFTVGASADAAALPMLSPETMYADDFLRYYTDVELSDEEADYLRLQSGFSLVYNTEIPTYTVKTTYEDGILTVDAEEYIYTSESGAKIVWIPVCATLGGEEKNFDGDPYTLSFSSLDADAEDKVKVDYNCKFVIEKEEVDRLFSLAYTDAPRLKAEIEEKRIEYEDLAEQYLADTEKYNAYLSAMAEYSAYLSVKRIYDEKYAEYSNYLDEKADYEIAKAAYDNYIKERDNYYAELAKYTEYLAYAEQNLAKIEEYHRYQQKYSVVMAQLDVINQTKTKLTPLDRTVYDAILGDTVTSVINRKGDIVKVLGANADVVDLAGVATENLRVLLKDFFELKTTEEQYRYYITNYEAFRDNFANLLIALDELYLVNRVRAAMISEDKHEKYLILVAQLYYVANALSDEPIKSYNGKYYFDSDYKIGSTYSSSKWSYPADVINHEPYIVDTNNASPLVDGYPIEPEKPEYTMMQEPVAPKPVANPVPPAVVEKPEAPIVVCEPQTVSKPGEKPEAYIPPQEVVAIIKAYDENKLVKRASYEGDDITVVQTVSVYRLFTSDDQVSVTYFDREYNDCVGKKKLYSITIDRGTCADYLGDPPIKNEDAEFVYTHCGWVNSNGEQVDLSCVTEDVELYPTFSSTEKEYNTVWIANGEVFYENPEIPPIPGNEFYYDFSHWEKSVNSITRDVTYTAVYKRPSVYVYDRPEVHTPKEVAKVRYEDGNYIVTPKGVSNKLNISALLERAYGAGGIIIKSPLGEIITISYGETIRMRDIGVCSIEYSVVAHSQGGFAYKFNLFDDKGQELDCDVKIAFSAECDIASDSHFKVLFTQNGEKTFLRNAVSGKTVTFSAIPGQIYYARAEYSVNSVPLDAVRIKLSHNTAYTGMLVAVSIDPIPGIRVDGIYYMTHDGKKVYLDGNTFTAPSDDVTVGVDYTVLRYKITFVSDGKTVVTYYRNYGETVIPPSDPQKAPNEKYSFTFDCWSPEISEVTGDANYRAVYTLTPLPPVERSMALSPSVLKLLLLATIGIGCVALIVIPSLIMTAVLICKRKRKLLRPKK